MRSSQKFSPITWVNWLEKGGKKNVGDKSWKFFKEGYIHDIYIGNELNEMPSSESPKLFYSRARSYRSLRKNEEPHYLFIGFCSQDNRVSISHARCSCKAGSGGHCNHVLGLIFLLNDISSSGILDIPSDATCTSRPQSCHIPRAASGCPLPIMATHYARSATDKTPVTRKKDPVRCKLYDARAPFARQSMGSETIMTEVNYLKGKDKKPPFSYLLEDQEPPMQINTVFGNMPLGSCLSYQLQDFGRPGTKFFSTRNIVKLANSLPCSGYPDIPIVLPGQAAYDFGELPENFASYCRKYLSIESTEVHNMERRTVLQGECKEWLNEHEKRITASNFGKIIYRIQRPSESMLKSIFKSKDFSYVRSISHGKSKEKVARTIYSNNMLKKVPNFAVYDASLSVHLSFPFIGATPDGKMYDPSENPPYGLLEIKCPFSKRKDTLVQASGDGTFYLEERENSFYLKRNHT